MVMLSVAEVRDRIVRQLATLDGWYLSRHAAEAMRDRMDSADIVHQSYAVSTPESAWMEGRQLRTPGAVQYTTTKVVVRWLYRIPVEDADGGYSLALDAEDVVRLAVLAVGTNPELSVRLDTATAASREVLSPSSGPLMLGTLTFLVNHQLSNA